MVRHLLLCLSIFLSVAGENYQIYVDNQEGSDDAECGTILHPCKTIPQDSTSVCLSSGTYILNQSIPSQLSWWKIQDGQKPSLYCTGDVVAPCDVEPNIRWFDLSMNGCNVLAKDCRDVIIQSMHLTSTILELESSNGSDFSVTHCLFNHTQFETYLDHTGSISSIFNDNIIINSRIDLHNVFHDFNSTVSQLNHNILQFKSLITVLHSNNDALSDSPSLSFQTNNNTCDNYIGNAARAVVSISLSLSGRLSGNLDFHLQVLGNTLPNLTIQFSPTTNIPDTILRGNVISGVVRISARMVRNSRVNELGTVLIEKNDVFSLGIIYERGLSYLGTVLVARNNNFRYFDVKPKSTSVEVYDNIIYNANIIKTDTITDRRNNLIYNNTIQLLTYEIVFPLGKLGVTNITRNHFSRLRIIAEGSIVYVGQNIYGGSLWKNAIALEVERARGSRIILSDVHVKNYSGIGVAIRNSMQTHFSLDSMSVSDCGGGISLFAYKSIINITSVELYNNTNTGVGGGLSISGNDNSIRIQRCRFGGNQAPHASAISATDVGYIQLNDITIDVEDDSVFPIVDHSVLVLSGNYTTENVNLLCTDRRYLLSVNSSSYLIWTCKPCDSGTYLLGRGQIKDDVQIGTSCLVCPEQGVECTNGDTPKAKPNYWCGDSSKGELICHNCPIGYCNQTHHSWNESCIGHRSGELCGGCADNYTLGFLTSSCLPLDRCRPQWIILLSFVPLVYAVVLFVLPIGDGSIWKSISYFVQTVPLLVRQERQSSIISMISSLFTMPTNMGSSSVGICIGDLNYIQREFVSLYIPLGTVFLLSLSCLCVLLYKKMKRIVPRFRFTILKRVLASRSMISRCTTATITAFLLVYSGLVSSYLKLYFCIEIEPSRWVMYNAGTEGCDQTWRKALVSVASILLLPSPLVLLFLRRRLKGTERETGKDVLIILDGCYRKGRKYWESVYMVRRLAIAVAYIFITDEQWSAFTMRVLLTTSLLVHLLLVPFVTATGQALETICLVSLCLLTILEGLNAPDYLNVFIGITVAMPIVTSAAMMVKALRAKILLSKKQKKEERVRLLLSEDEPLEPVLQ
ncbi:hypothetical protein PROFUN_06222 [Planoprotostelium fungivorum]|uniref:Right handed beta helix domain-containing protein n=1 Tax=Planoprotostelium fungivorum TaxID=1890364 RepID=A0A2P6MZ26_9EUKA|nr:hypothetical protein PROFUN_06222 [Planoprotostelium fungivorum]